MNYISLVATIVSFVFAGSVLIRYRRRRGTHLLMWGIGLILYGLGTLSEVILSLTFSGFVLKVWYISGAMLTAAWLGQGSIWLLVRKPGVARILTIVLGAISLLSIVLVMAAPLTVAAAGYDVSRPASEQYQDILVRSGLITALTITLNIYGTIALVGGALYSAYLFWRKSILLNRVIGNVLIALGALSPAIAGSLVGAGMVDLLYVSELVGVLLMYLGFVMATSKAPTQQRRPSTMAVN